MKIISLNVWMGRLYDRLEAFLRKMSNDTDVFLFQEVLSEPRLMRPDVAVAMDGYAKHGSIVFDLQQRLQKILSNHIWVASFSYADFGHRLSMFYRVSLPVDDYGDELILKPIRQDIGNGVITSQGVRIQWIRVGDLVVAHFHGAWIRGVYGDCPERKVQSERVLSVLERIGGRSAVMGDMNLRPESEGVRILKSRLRNLVEEFGVTNTRSPTFSFAGSTAMITDYAFVSHDVIVKDFKVLPDEVSDHLPLYLDIE